MQRLVLATFKTHVPYLYRFVDVASHQFVTLKLQLGRCRRVRSQYI